MSYREKVRKVIPYVPGEQPSDSNMIKLNTNENPYPPSPAVERALQQIAPSDLKLYPDPCAKELVQAIATQYQVDTSQVFVGVGSDDVLAMAFLTFFNSESPILFPDITYSFYDVWAELFHIPYKQIPLDDDFKINAEDYYHENRANGGIIFPNPNAPTGVDISISAIESIINHNRDSLVIVDEAYVDFGTQSAISLIDQYDNLLVVQTFSKSRALAGMRIGYAIGNKELISYLNDVKYSFNSYTMDLVTIKTGTAAINDNDYFKKMTDKVVKTREWTKKELAKLGFSFGDSKANFLFVTNDRVPARELFKKLRSYHIYVRYFDKPRIDNYLRITIGTQEEMQTLINTLKKIL